MLHRARSALLLLVVIPVLAHAQSPVTGALHPRYSVLYSAAPARPRLNLRDRAPALSVPRTRWKHGALIGGTIGGVGLGALAYALCRGLSETQTNCLGPTVGGVAVGALAGGVVGGLIGGQFPDSAAEARASAP